MSKVAYQPLTVLVTAQTSNSRPISNSAKVLRAAATFVALFTLFGAVAICSIGFRAFTPRAPGAKESAGVPVFPAAKVPPGAAADLDNGIGLLPEGTNQAHQGTSPLDHSTIEQTPLPALNPPPPATSVAPPEAKALVDDSAILEREGPETAPKSLPEIPKAVRKKLEKERRQAERQRSRLEDRYQKHAISIEAYKKGEEQYKSAIERYRTGMNAGRGPKNEPEF